jgi:predicted ATP-binding protein involved in virulence
VVLWLQWLLVKRFANEFVKIMRVKELTLHNFRGIKDLHLEFDTNHNVVVLVGINGVGKSSILDCINILIKHYIASYRHESFRISRIARGNFAGFLAKSDIRNGERIITNRILYIQEEDEIEWQITNRNMLMKDSTIDIDNLKSNPVLNLDGRCFYYLSNRRVIEFRRGQDGINNSEEIINFKDLSNWFKETEDLENERRLSDDIGYRHPELEAVRTAVALLLGTGYRDLTFKRSIGKMIVTKSSEKIAIELLSDGEKSLLAMVSHLSRRLASNNKNSNKPLESPALVLIDEIELHLHPAWQRMIIPRLTQIFPNCQFIITTHSPQVLSHVDPECIHILDYEGDNVVVKRPENSFGLDSNRILEDILGVPKRPEEIQNEMLELFRTINNNDLETAKKIVRELGDKIGINEPELVKAEATIKRREIIGR